MKTRDARTRDAILGLALVSIITMVLSLGSCNMLGLSDEPDDQLEEDVEELSDDAQQLAEDAAVILGGVIEELSVQIPKALQEIDRQINSTGFTTMADLDYSSLDDVTSPAHRSVTFHARALESNVEDINTSLEVFKEQIDSVEMAPDSPYEDPPNEEGNVLRMKYTTEETTFGDTTHNWFIFEIAEFTSDDNFVGGSYLEVAELEDGSLTGMSMHADVVGSETRRHKVAFDTGTGSITSYMHVDDSATDVVDEVGKVQLNPDPNNPETGIELAFKYVGAEFGSTTQTAWATDEYGAVLAHFDGDTSTAGDEHISMEYFAVDEENDTSKIIYRLRGQQEPQYLFERIYRGRAAIGDPDADVWDAGTINAYSADFESSEEGVVAPKRLFLEYDNSTDTTSFAVYPGTPEDMGTPATDAEPVYQSNDPDVPGENVWRVFWLGGDSTSLQTGDAVYRPIDQVQDGDMITREYYKVAEIFAPTKLFGYEGEFFLQEMTPLKYLTGAFDGGNTVIQVDEEAYGSGEDAEDRYYIDANNDQTFGTLDQIGENDPPDAELLVWLQSETYYDEKQQEEVTIPAEPWLMGDLPEVPVSGGASLTFSYESELETIASRFSGMMDPENEDYLAETTVDPFPVLGEKWKTISSRDFE